jgi:hypothetical protein
MEGLGIIPECYIDTCLAETITSCSNQFNHQKGCGTVSKVMKEKFKDRFALGIIDKDKNEIPYLQDFDLVASKDSLYLYKYKTKHHYIIQIEPAIEKFFLKAAEEKNINLTTYGLPVDLGKLTKLTKQISDKNETVNKNFIKLFRDLSDTSEFQRLARIILYLGENTYKADVEELKEIIQ